MHDRSPFAKFEASWGTLDGLQMLGKILVVEEDAAVASELEGRLQALGYAVTLIGDGQSGLVRAVTERFDAILVSADLPGMNGFRVCNRIKRDPTQANIIVLLASTAIFYQRYRQSASEYADSKAAEEAARTSYGNAITSIAEIQDSLGAIAVGDSSLRMRAGMRTEGGRQAQDREALERIAVLKAGVERTKQRIHELEVRVQKSGLKMAGLQKMISGLKRDLADREMVIGQLSTQVDSLHTTVNVLSTTVAAKSDTIVTQTANLEQRRRELDTIYYVIGDKKSLTDQGILVAKGGVLGLGKTLKPTGDYTPTHFTALDLDQDTVVKIPGKKAQILSEQPPSSYQLSLVGDSLELRITDPTQFRAVKHLVIMTS